MFEVGQIAAKMLFPLKFSETKFLKNIIIRSRENPKPDNSLKSRTKAQILAQMQINIFALNMFLRILNYVFGPASQNPPAKTAKFAFLNKCFETSFIAYLTG